MQSFPITCHTEVYSQHRKDCKYGYTVSLLGPEFLRVDAGSGNDSVKGMIRSGFLSSAERLELEACVRSQREDHGIARRANAILLLDDGKSCQVIAEFFYLDDDTIRGWYKCYRESGWEALSVDGWKGGQSRLTAAQEVALCNWLDGRFCRSTVEIQSSYFDGIRPALLAFRLPQDPCPAWI